MLDRKMHPITYDELVGFLDRLIDQESARIRESMIYGDMIYGDPTIEYLLEIKERLWMHEDLQH